MYFGVSAGHIASFITVMCLLCSCPYQFGGLAEPRGFRRSCGERGQLYILYLNQSYEHGSMEVQDDKCVELCQPVIVCTQSWDVNVMDTFRPLLTRLSLPCSSAACQVLCSISQVYLKDEEIFSPFSLPQPRHPMPG